MDYIYGSRILTRQFRKSYETPPLFYDSSNPLSLVSDDRLVINNVFDGFTHSIRPGNLQTSLSNTDKILYYGREVLDTSEPVVVTTSGTTSWFSDRIRINICPYTYVKQSLKLFRRFQSDLMNFYYIVFSYLNFFIQRTI